MQDAQNKKYEIYDLLVLLVENDLTDCQRDYLLEWSRKDPDAINIYHQFLRTYAIISSEIESRVEFEYGESADTYFDNAIWVALAQDEINAPAIEVQKQQEELIQKVVYPPREKYTITKFSIITFITSAAAALLLAALYFSTPESHPVASITDECKAVWEDVQNVKGTRLWNDGKVHHLKRGVVELTLDSGAAVLIESPAYLEVLDENRIYFEGRLTAQVPQSASRFTVETSNSTVVDLGTEFGLLAFDTQITEVHVRKGTVEHMAGTDTGDSDFTQLVLNTGQASRMDGIGNLSRMTSRNEQFRWKRPNEYEMTVIEAKPLAYYRFEKETLGFDEISRTVTSGDFTGQFDFVGGPEIESGNQALRFNGEAGSEVFIADKTSGDREVSNSLSISFWVRPERVGQCQNVIIQTNSKKTLAVSFTNRIFLTEDNRVAFYLYNDGGEGRVHISTQLPIALNQWSYITASYSKENMRLYVNGNLETFRAIKETGSPRSYPEGYWAIGSTTGLVGESDILAYCSSFKGSVDEFALFSRQLSDEEVIRLYEAAKIH